MTYNLTTPMRADSGFWTIQDDLESKVYDNIELLGLSITHWGAGACVGDTALWVEYIFYPQDNCGEYTVECLGIGAGPVFCGDALDIALKACLRHRDKALAEFRAGL